MKHPFTLPSPRLVRPGRLSIFHIVIGVIVLVPALATAQVCGNAVREVGEQCDDGSRASFDGCSARCRFEQTQRINQIALEGVTGTCLANALGGLAFTSLSLGLINPSLSTDVGNGSTSILLYLRGLADPTGMSTESNLQLGVLDSSPDPGYSPANEVDWWFAVDESELGTSQNPLSVLNANTANGALGTEPGSLSLNLFLGTPVSMSMSSATITAQIGMSTTPMSYVNGTDRGHQASENLDPSLQGFVATGTGTTKDAICGNVSAASLAAAPAPVSLISVCTQGYTALNSLLDVIVGGCTFAVIQLVNATEPDATDPGAPVAGAGGPYHLIGAGNHFITTCKDKTNATVSLSTCLNAAAYSVHFSLATDRVIAKSTSAADIIFYDNFDELP